MRGLLALLLLGCGPSPTIFDPDVLTGSVVRSSRTEIEVASDFADSATTIVDGVDGIALGVHAGDRVRVRRLDPSVGKTDPLDWDCRVRTMCEVVSEGR